MIASLYYETREHAGEFRAVAKTVLFATVLFFASASGKFEQQRVRLMTFTFAGAVFIFAVVGTVMLSM